MGQKPILDEQALEKIKSLSFKNLIDYRTICDEFNVSHKTAQRAMRKLEIKHASQKTIDILKEYVINKKTSTEIAKIFCVTRDDINKIVKLYGFTRKYRLVFNRRNKIKCNYRYFKKIDTPAKAYFLGFIYADGCVTGKSLQIAINKKDKNLLIKFKKHLNTNANIREYSYKTNFGKGEVCELSIYSDEMFNDLVSNGVIPNKTFKTEFPYKSLDKSLYKDFIRGYIDGDGSFNVTEKLTTETFKRKHLSKNGLKEYSYTYTKMKKNFNFNVCGNLNLLKEIKNIIVKTLNLKCNPRLYERWPERKTSNRSFVITGKKNLLKITDWLYKDANVYLDRKYKNYLKILKVLGDSAVLKLRETVELQTDKAVDNTVLSLDSNILESVTTSDES